jgi:hypothetical protein
MRVVGGASAASKQAPIEILHVLELDVDFHLRTSHDLVTLITATGMAMVNSKNV